MWVALDFVTNSDRITTKGNIVTNSTMFKIDLPHFLDISKWSMRHQRFHICLSKSRSLSTDRFLIHGLNCQIFFYYFENTHQKRTYIVLFPYNNTSTYVKQYCEQLYPSNFGLFDVINEQFAVKIFIIKWLTE